MISWAAHRPAVVWASCAALLLAGGVAFVRLPLAARTTVELPQLEITASWPGASAELVEMYLTSPMEAAVQSVRGVRKTSSESIEGEASIRADLDPDTDVQLARLGILERMEVLRPEFPSGAASPQVQNFVPDELEEEPLLRYGVTGPYTPGSLSRIVREKVEPQVSAVPGVARARATDVAQIGVAVTYDARLLREMGIAPAALQAALRDSRLVQALGEEQRGSTERHVVLRDQPEAMEQLADLPVPGAGGRVYRLGEFATIRVDEDDRGYFYRIDGQTAVSLSVSRLPGADAIRTAERVRHLMDELAPALPPGIRVNVLSDESVALREQLDDLLLRGGIAFAAVMLVLVLTLRNAKSVALVMGSAAVSIAGTALGLYLLDIPANLLTLAGLGMGIGVLVQNGLVVVERLRSVPDTAEGRAAAGVRILPAVAGSTLTTAVVLFPFLYLQGNARAAFIPFAAAFALALGWSVLTALVMVPALGAGHGMHDAGWPRLRRGYEWMVERLARRRWVTLGITTVVLGVLAWGFVKKVPKSSFGGFWFGQRTTLGVNLSFPRGSDPESLDRGMREFEAIAVGIPGVEQVMTQGRPDGAGMRVVFEDEAGLGPLPYELQEALTQRALLIGGAQVSVQGRGPGFYGGGGAGGSTSYRIKILGYSFGGVEALAKDFQRRLERIPRVRNVNINAGSFFGRERVVTVSLEPDRAALARYGITAADFASAVSREVRGPVGAQRLEIAGEEIQVTLKSAGTRDRTLDNLREALIPNSTGTPVRLGDLARVEEREGLSAISREDQQYVRIVGYEFRGPPKLANRTHTAFMKSISVPAGYWVGDDEFAWGSDESSKGLWLVFGIGVALVLLSVAMVFDSVWAAAMVFLSLPIALGGVVAAFWVAESAFTREAAVGVILVVGLAVNQSILLIDAALERRRAQGARRGLGVADVVAAASERSGMIVLVTLTTIASLIPLAVGTEADSLFGAIALATAGGTLFGTIAALFVVPAMVGGGKRP
jgi:HAE1 family hydrophobic/amphiphilic exporter-1